MPPYIFFIPSLLILLLSNRTFAAEAVPKDLHEAASQTAEAAKEIIQKADTENPIIKIELIDPKNDRIDEIAKTCTIEAPPRIRALMDLHILETRLQDRIDVIHKKVQLNPKMTEAEFEKLIGQAELEAKQETQNFLSRKITNDLALKGLRETEVHRLHAEFYGRLALAVLPDKEKSLKMAELAKTQLQIAKNNLKSVPAQMRAQESPRLLQRLAETTLSIGQFQKLAGPEYTSREIATENLKVLNHFRENYTAQEHEKAQLDLLALESFVSLSDSKLGDFNAHPSLTINLRKEFARIQQNMSSLPKKFASLEQEELEMHRIQDRAAIISRLVPFYTKDSDLNQNLANLDQDINSSDPTRKKAAEVVASYVAENQMGTYTSHQILTKGAEWGNREHFNYDELYRTYQVNAAEYQDSISDTLTPEMQTRFQLPNYKELTSSKGYLGNVHYEFTTSLALIAKVQEDQKKMSEEEFENAMLNGFLNSDLTWIQMQCLRYANGDAGFANPSKVEAPFKSMKVDFRACKNAKSAKEAEQIAYKITETGIFSKRNTEIAWIAGEFAFDVASVLATGGVASIIKKGTQKTLRAAGKKMLHSGMNATVVKAGTRTAGFASGIMVTDLSAGSVKGLRNFVQEGLRDGSWDIHNVPEGIAYFNPEISSKEHAARLFTTALASRGLDVLWKKVPTSFVDKLPSRIPAKTVTQAGEAAKITVNNMAGRTAEHLAAIPNNGLESLRSARDEILDPVVWGEEFASSVKGRVIKDGLGKSKLLNGRTFTKSFVDKLGDMKLKVEDLAKLKEISSCMEAATPSNTETSN